MVATGKYEKDDKSCQYQADCSTDRHRYHYPAPSSAATTLAPDVLKGLSIFSERMFLPAGNRHMDTS
jgi:hypothetical protein